MPKKPTIEDTKSRFLEKLEVVDGCWIWQGQRLPKGYGMFFMPKAFRTGKSMNITAHRASYMLFNGPIPEGMVVCHSCDKPECVNPEHLFLGSSTDNMRDCAAKGRVNTAKLSPHQVLEIRESLESVQSLAGGYGVTETTINAVKRGKTHIELGGRIVETTRKIDRSLADKISQETGRQVDIAAKYGVSQSTVSAIKRGVFFKGKT